MANTNGARFIGCTRGKTRQRVIKRVIIVKASSRYSGRISGNSLRAAGFSANTTLTAPIKIYRDDLTTIGSYLTA